MAEISSKHITFGSNKKNAISNPYLVVYENKCIELNVTKDAMNMYHDSFVKKKRILEEETRKLEELHYQVWSLEDSFCEQVWQFSYEHDFSNIFKHHPFLTEMSHCTEQRNQDEIRDTKFIDLINEIDTIRTEISKFDYINKNVRRELEDALMKFRKLQLISDEITELLSLINPSESSEKFVAISMPIYDEIMIPNYENRLKRSLKDRKAYNNQDKSSIKNKCSKDINKPNVISNKKAVFMTSNNYPQLFLERSIIFTKKTIMDISTASTSSEKLKSFTFKKRSKISIRFEEHRESVK